MAAEKGKSQDWEIEWFTVRKKQLSPRNGDCLGCMCGGTYTNAPLDLLVLVIASQSLSESFKLTCVMWCCVNDLSF